MQSFIASHDLDLVALSYAVSVVGAFISFYLAQFIRDREGRINFSWLSLSAVVLGGCAIWAMHFTGMLAFNPAAPVTYDVATTALSAAIPILLSGVGLYVAFRWENRVAAWLGAGVVFGLGVASMHYIGMAAVRMPMAMTHNPIVTALAVAIAIFAAVAALRIVVHWRGTKRLLSPLVVGLAVCGMHYTAMMGMSFVPLDSAQLAVDYFDGAWTESTIAFLAGLGVSLTLFVGAALSVFLKMVEIQDASESYA